VGTPPRNRIACGTNDALFGFIILRRNVRQSFRRMLASGGVGLYSGGMVRSANDPMTKTPKKKGGTDSELTGKAVGDALREAYDQAASEAIPDELLDLLKKLD
jgi:hypothetical protein